MREATDLSIKICNSYAGRLRYYPRRITTCNYFGACRGGKESAPPTRRLLLTTVMLESVIAAAAGVAWRHLGSQPVFDQTGLSGEWSFNLSYSLPTMESTDRSSADGAFSDVQVLSPQWRPIPEHGPEESTALAAEPSGALTIFGSRRKQLGLRLEAQADVPGNRSRPPPTDANRQLAPTRVWRRNPSPAH